MIKAVVTGHRRGLGRAVADALTAAGVPVLGLARHAPGAEGLPPGSGEVCLDLADPAALAHWLAGPELADFLADAETAVLINNAGVLRPLGLGGDLDATEAVRAVALNVTAPLLLANAFLAASRHLADRRILHVSSGAARHAYAGWSVYCATKAALDRHAEALALEGHPGLRIASVAPGVIDTGMQAEIRAADPADFPLQQRFVQLKQSGELTSPAAAAARLVDYLLGPRFGERVLSDLRDDYL